MSSDLYVIIPAFNEEFFIGRTLDQYVEGVKAGLFKVIVSCNACTDRTPDIVKEKYSEFILLESDIPSKVMAINSALTIVDKGSFVVVQDADIMLTQSSLLELYSGLKKSSALIASPKVVVDYVSSSKLVKLYYDFLTSTPVFKKGMVNSGVYMLSPLGLEVINYRLPNVISDDGFVREKLSINGIFLTENSTSLVTAPVDLYSLIKIKTRSKLGNIQLKKEIFSEKSNRRFLISKVILFRPKALVYLSINIYCKIRSFFQYGRLENYKWEKDESSRKDLV